MDANKTVPVLPRHLAGGDEYDYPSPMAKATQGSQAAPVAAPTPAQVAPSTSGGFSASLYENRYIVILIATVIVLICVVGYLLWSPTGSPIVQEPPRQRPMQGAAPPPQRQPAPPAPASAQPPRPQPAAAPAAPPAQCGPSPTCDITPDELRELANSGSEEDYEIEEAPADTPPDDVQTKDTLCSASTATGARCRRRASRDGLCNVHLNAKKN